MDCIGFQLRRKHPFRCDGDAEVGKHARSNTHRSVQTNSTTEANRCFRGLLPEGPCCAAQGLLVGDDLMCHEVSRNPRHARSVEIRGYTYYTPLALSDLAGG